MLLDKTEMKILRVLQDDARITNQELADKIGMSASPCWRKVRRLEEQGVIQGYRAVLDRKKIGAGVMVFIRVVIDCHSEDEAKNSSNRLRRWMMWWPATVSVVMPISCYRLWRAIWKLMRSSPCL